MEGVSPSDPPLPFRDPRYLLGMHGVFHALTERARERGPNPRVLGLLLLFQLALVFVLVYLVL